MSYVRVSGKSSIPRMMPYYTWAQAAAVQNTWYKAFEAQNARILYIIYDCTVANETVEIRLTIDGEVCTYSKALTHTTPYYLTREAASASKGFVSSTSNLTVGRSSFIEAKSIKIELRKTTAGGASALELVVMYNQES